MKPPVESLRVERQAAEPHSWFPVEALRAGSRLSNMPSWTFNFTPTAPSWAVDWTAIQSAFDWVRDMEAVPQDALWHAEGNVLVHTRMVAEALAADPDWRVLPEEERHLVFAAALLHDVAKGVTTREEAGRIVAPKHTVVGQRMARRLLWSGSAGAVPGFAAREALAGLVRFHGLPLRFLDKPSPERAIVTASLAARIDLTALLARADVTGRLCAGQAELLDRVSLFAEFCAELECLAGPKRFESDAHRFSYCVLGKDYAYVPFDDTRFEVTLMSGLPAAGKSHWVNDNARDQPVIRLDDLRVRLGIDPADRQGAVVNAAKEQAKRYMREGRSFVWDATNVTRPMREQLVALFGAYKGRVRVVYAECPMGEWRRRNRDRHEPVPDEVMTRLLGKLDVPTSAEAHRVEFAIEST